MQYITSLPARISLNAAKCGTAFYLHSLALSQALAFGGNIPDITSTATGGSGATRNSVVKFINFVLTFLALLAVIFVIIGGIRILTAGGNDEQVTKGRKTIIYALIGLLIIFFARVIVGFVTSEIATNVAN